MRTLISNGTIVTADGSYAADVLIDGETITQIGMGLAASGSVTADETIDAAGRYVIPGGIDVHTHMELPFGGTFAKDTFETGTRAAAHGGTTTIVDFAVQSKGKSLREGLDAWHAKAEGNAVADYGFHMIMSDVTDDTLKEMDQLVSEGIPDFKLFTAYPGVFYSDDGAIFRAMQQTAKNGGLIMMHAENGMAIDVVAAELVDEGKTDPYYHGVARYPIFEGEATNRVIRLAEAAGVPVYIVHLSARDALDAVRQARDRGSKTFAETCPQYLFLSLDDLGNGFDGREVRLLAAAPLEGPLGRALDGTREGRPPARLDRPLPVRLPRPEGAGQGRLPKGPQRPARASRTGSTCSTTAASSPAGSRRSAGSRSSRRRRRSCSGCTRRRARSRSARTPTSSSTTRTRPATISAKTHHMDVDYSCYEGRSVQGRSDIVLSRGSVIVRDGEFTGRKGAGKFVKRAPADFARLS